MGPCLFNRVQIWWVSRHSMTWAPAILEGDISFCEAYKPSRPSLVWKSSAFSARFPFISVPKRRILVELWGRRRFWLGPTQVSTDSWHPCIIGSALRGWSSSHRCFTAEIFRAQHSVEMAIYQNWPYIAPSQLKQSQFQVPDSWSDHAGY